MVWQEKILSRISYERNCPRLVADNTGVLLSAAFTGFLEKRAIPFTIANNHQELLSASTDLIITALKTIPTFIVRKRVFIEFTFAFLPIDGNTQILKRLSLENLVEILDYSDTHSIQYISAANVDGIVDMAVRSNCRKRASQIDEWIADLLQQERNYDNVLKIGFLCGERLYNSFIGQCLPDIEESSVPDNAVMPFWQTEHYRNTYYLPLSDFKNVDKICPYIKSRNYDKVALICFDGMGISEWLLIQEYLQKKSGLKFLSRPVFSLIPSITHFSRKAVFGAPYQDIYTRNLPEDSSLFSSFFSDRQVRFFREKDSISEDSLLGIDAVGVLYSFIDEISHNIVLPSGTRTKEIYFKAILEYVKQSSVTATINLLHSSGFKIFIGSDHGNALCYGNGHRVEKYLIDKYSSRATVGKESVLLELTELEKVEIPFVADKFAFLAKNRECFAPEGQVAISHGGLSVEEMVIPFVEVIN
ncbi:MAG: PglZ domain-containing protein [Fibrobacter sp.]|nr:PglZ domain-containing protein [Fibrobacter sp.]